MCELCFSWEEERDVVVLEAIGLWACNVQISAKDKGFDTKKRPEIRRWFLRVILSWVSNFYPILRVTYRGTDIFLIKFTGKLWKSKKSFLGGHNWEGVNTKF